MGRPSKGPRRHLSAKIPISLVEAMDEEAKRRGLDRTALIVEALAAKYGITNPMVTQETLPLPHAA
jgi:hypothetical protein